MICLYQILLFALLVLVGPFLLISSKARAGLREKFGFIGRSLRIRTSSLGTGTKRIWFHAVSVGEFNALYPLVDEFCKAHPSYKIFISTTTRTGQELARKKSSAFAEIFYFPFDLPFAVSAWLNLIQPEMVVIVETEIWPGFMDACKKRGVKVLLINGRLSPRSYKGYMRFAWFFRETVKKFTALALQSETEKSRFMNLAGPFAPPIEVCGNIKLDGLKPCSANETNILRNKLNLGKDELVVVAGSTHEGEEAALIAALKKHDFRFRLILVPRHPERFERVAQLITESGLRARRFSLSQSFEDKTDVYLLDTIGQLSKFYSVADMAFVGGTLVDIGGHNLSEPCVYKVPVICGPHIHKARDMYQRLSESNAVLMANDEEELSSVLSMLMNEPSKRQELGANGYRFLVDNQGALAKTLVLLEKYLDDKGSCDSASKLETAGGAYR